MREDIVLKVKANSAKGNEIKSAKKNGKKGKKKERNRGKVDVENE